MLGGLEIDRMEWILSRQPQAPVNRGGTFLPTETTQGCLLGSSPRLRCFRVRLYLRACILVRGQPLSSFRPRAEHPCGLAHHDVTYDRERRAYDRAHKVASVTRCARSR